MCNTRLNKWKSKSQIVLNKQTKKKMIHSADHIFLEIFIIIFIFNNKKKSNEDRYSLSIL